jgi:hypothetical protein
MTKGTGTRGIEPDREAFPDCGAAAGGGHWSWHNSYSGILGFPQAPGVNSTAFQSPRGPNQWSPAHAPVSLTRWTPPAQPHQLPLRLPTVELSLCHPTSDSLPTPDSAASPDKKKSYRLSPILPLAISRGQSPLTANEARGQLLPLKAFRCPQIPQRDDTSGS